MIIIKTEKQIEGIKKACQLAAQTLTYASTLVNDQNITALDIDHMLAQYIKNHNGKSACLNYHGFPNNTCISINEEVCHGIPNNRKFNDGDLIKIDVSVILDGYFGDTCGTFSIGESIENQKLINVTKRCLEIGINEVKPNNFFGNIGYRISKYAHKKQCSVVEDFCGHGVGLQLHEPPQVYHIDKKNTGDKMKPGMIFTIEPMINIGKANVFVTNDNWTVRTSDGEKSAQFEHTVLVTNNGYEILT